MAYLGIDSSNYRSSVGVVFEDNSYISNRKLLFVEKGKRGLRQSDAVFLHTKQLPDILADTLNGLERKDIKCVSVSATPRNVENSYMPCFLSGLALAKSVSAALNVPMYEFSHQEGHIAAAILSANRLDLLNKRFIAFHLSGGTTEALLVEPFNGRFNVKIIGKTLDINAGQVIDRVGVMLGLSFPGGPELEILAEKGKLCRKIKPCIKGYDLAFSGVENICKDLLCKNEPYENIAATALNYVVLTVLELALKIKEFYGDLPFVFSGGVAANKFLRKTISEKLNADFASSELSGDNAVGTALLGKLKTEN